MRQDLPRPMTASEPIVLTLQLRSDVGTLTSPPLAPTAQELSPELPACIEAMQQQRADILANSDFQTLSFPDDRTADQLSPCYLELELPNFRPRSAMHQEVILAKPQKDEI
jgi:hypothetical protein